MKHTPGPWKVDDLGDVVRAEDNGLVASCFDGLLSSDTDDIISLANAKLIAAAPLGYALAEEIVNHLYTKQDIDRIRTMAKQFLEVADAR